MVDFDPQGAKTGEYDEWGGNFKMPGEGWHVFQIVHAERTETKDEGKPMLSVRASVILSDDEESMKASLFENFILEKKFFGKLSSFCTAVDPEMRSSGAMDGKSTGDGSGLDLDDQDSIDYHIFGQPFRARVYHKTEKKGRYKGKTSAKVGEFDGVRKEDAIKLRELYGDDLVPEVEEPSHGDSDAAADDVY